MWTLVGCQTLRSALWWLPLPGESVEGQRHNEVFILFVVKWLLWYRINSYAFVPKQIYGRFSLVAHFTSIFIWYTCSGTVSCSRLLCLRVVWRILTSSTGLHTDSRGFSSKRLSTKLSWRWGSSDRNNLGVTENTEWGNCDTGYRYRLISYGTLTKIKKTKWWRQLWKLKLQNAVWFCSLGVNLNSQTWNILYSFVF